MVMPRSLSGRPGATAYRLSAPRRWGEGYEWFLDYEGWNEMLAEGRNATTAYQRGRSAEILKSALRLYSPKLTGRLSRRWKVSFLTSGKIRLRNPQPYANYQNTVTRNRHYIDRAILAAANAITLTLIQGQVQRLEGAARRDIGGGFIPQPAATFDPRLVRIERKLQNLRPPGAPTVRTTVRLRGR